MGQLGREFTNFMYFLVNFLIRNFDIKTILTSAAYHFIASCTIESSNVLVKFKT